MTAKHNGVALDKKSTFSRKCPACIDFYFERTEELATSIVP